MVEVILYVTLERQFEFISEKINGMRGFILYYYYYPLFLFFSLCVDKLELDHKN